MQRARGFRTFILPVILSLVTMVSGAEFHSPGELAFAPDGRLLAVADTARGSVWLIDPADGQGRQQVTLEGAAGGLVWSADGSRLYVAESGAGSIAWIDPAEGRVIRRFEVGRYPRGLALSPRRKLLLVADYGRDRLRVLDADSGKPLATLATGCQPVQVAVSPDESLAVVSNLIPATAATDPRHASEVTLVALDTLKVLATVHLPPGSTNARGVAISPDGRTAHVVHTLGRFHLPTTQLDRGWVITNALSVIDLQKRERIATVLLDQATDGAADPWDVAIDPQGRSLYVTLSGVHQLAILDLPGLIELVSTADAETLTNDLFSLHRRKLLRRIDLPVNGPRGIAVSSDGSRLAVAACFSGEVVTAAADGGAIRSLSLGQQPEPDLVRRGEIAYHDASRCFQRWLSCSSCHPDARADGLNWDLLNDGIGNPKNARTMVLTDRTPPMMALGVRARMQDAVKAGFIHIQFTEPDPATTQAVIAYLASLEPVVSPYRQRDGSLTASAERGRKIFNRPEVGCASCHPAPLHTDLELTDVGTGGALDQGATAFDTPALREIWRTPPYLHDGRAATLGEVLIEHNRTDQHGTTSKLTPAELEDLTQYLLSL